MTESDSFVKSIQMLAPETMVLFIETHQLLFCPAASGADDIPAHAKQMRWVSMSKGLTNKVGAMTRPVVDADRVL